MQENKLNLQLARLLGRTDQEIEKLIASYEKQLLSSYKSALNEIRKQIARIYERYGDKLTYDDLIAYNRLTNLEKEIASIITEIAGENIKVTNKALKDVFSSQFKQTVSNVEFTLGLNINFGIVNPDIVKAALVNSFDRIGWPNRLKDNTELLNKQVQSELVQGLIQGSGYAKIANSLKNKLDIGAYKSLRIIRTEGHRVQSAARIYALDESRNAARSLGIETSMKWLSTADVRTRDSHIAMEGQEADEEGKFTLPSGQKIDGPGLSGIAEEDINCRCTVIMEIKKMPETISDNLKLIVT